MKGAATRQLEREGLHPLARHGASGERPPKCWGHGEWKVYLDPEDVPLAIRYVQGNPVKEGKKAQNRSFVRKYQG